MRHFALFGLISGGVKRVLPYYSCRRSLLELMRHFECRVPFSLSDGVMKEALYIIDVGGVSWS